MRWWWRWPGPAPAPEKHHCNSTFNGTSIREHRHNSTFIESVLGSSTAIAFKYVVPAPGKHHCNRTFNCCSTREHRYNSTFMLQNQFQGASMQLHLNSTNTREHQFYCTSTLSAPAPEKNKCSIIAPITENPQWNSTGPQMQHYTVRQAWQN